ncbi:hypothetical protein N644_0371 [Lactiplantibacillus paraplantarum]|uniref:Uncharacterized protein n=1 Tax=Lactiplantibacillus paraplantarum TaxID=60520 RepID=A0ABQ0NAA0_9LACO|nr:hypothetical protein N644_0371 [Lactiplantibacillus paraplantarum]GBF02015.1 hypothetical protein LPPLD21_01547 [Lactiplantibacillus paraplantarum]
MTREELLDFLKNKRSVTAVNSGIAAVSSTISALNSRK